MTRERRAQGSSRSRKRWRAGWLGSLLVAVAALTGCGPLTRLYLERPSELGGVPPEQVPFVRLSSSLAESEAELVRLGFEFNPPGTLGSTVGHQYGFERVPPDIFAASTLRYYYRPAWHRGRFILLCQGDRVLFVAWHLSNMSP